MLHIALHSVGVCGVQLMGPGMPLLCIRMLRQAVHSAQGLLRMLLHAGWRVEARMMPVLQKRKARSDALSEELRGCQQSLSECQAEAVRKANAGAVAEAALQRALATAEADFRAAIQVPLCQSRACEMN